MLKNIRLHLLDDETLQVENDKKLASHIFATHNANINAFQRNIPSLLPIVQAPNLANYSLFINKYAENNIVDYGMGRTFYGFHPEEEVLEQVKRIEQHCPEVVFKAPSSHQEDDSTVALNIEDLASLKHRNLQPPMPYEIECLVVLGCGLGIHFRHLLKHHKIKNLLVYEPELQYFQCSVMTTSWQEIFNLANEHNTAIFLQLEKDGRDLIQDINELQQHCAISSFHLYKHYNHQVFDSIHKDLSERSWSEIESSGFKLTSKESYLDFLPSWTPNIDVENHSLLCAPNQKLSKNLDAFKKYFPDIYKEFKDYTPKKWQPIANTAAEVNLVKIDSLHTWYAQSPKQDCTLNFENFNEQPNKDGLVLGYKGTKLAHYIHYQFVKETEELLKQAEEEVGALPDNVPSIIMFGLGVGYQLEKLLEEHTVEKLFICEPNPDFFYASLFAIDWQAVFETVEKSETRIYLNIGDDGTNLFRDLLSQFYAIGPYILNSTYFYQSYYNASLNSAISQLREQLQVVISMGEYFDHAYYGIAHTKEGMRRKIPALAANPANKLSYDDKEVPIFIVGNGPSLDSSIEAIKEWQGQAIIVSCGTALQALHRHGIKPDFHAEIEQNRSTFDWAVLIGDLDYLKNITLISCNGIHPDTCDLYKDVLIAFKEGESSTVSALNVLGRENFTTLLNAFPTVSNFAIDLFSTIGFTSIYLIGVDLGFVDVKHHHSKSSGYYQEDGKETYDFTKSANTSLIVPGNFRATVNTKHEFKVSRQVIEQVTSAKPKGQEFYNCSDGAKIRGALPIRPDELLIVIPEQQKTQLIEKLKTKVFSIKGLSNYEEQFERTFSQSLLIEELDAFEALLQKEVTSNEDVEYIINKQKEMLFTSYKNGKSLLFYYLYGTVNYTNAVLTKLNSVDKNSSTHSSLVSFAKQYWHSTLKEITQQIQCHVPQFDNSSFNAINRQKILNNHNANGKRFVVVTSSTCFAKSITYQFEQSQWNASLTVTPPEKLNELSMSEFDFAIYYRHNLLDKLELSQLESDLPILGTNSTILAIDNDKLETIEVQKLSKISVMPIAKCKNELTKSLWRHDDTFVAYTTLRASLQNHKGQLILPKYITKKGLDSKKLEVATKIEHFRANYLYDFAHYVIAQENQDNNPLIPNGTRGQLINRKLNASDFISTEMEGKKYSEAIAVVLKKFPEELNDKKLPEMHRINHDDS